MFAVWGLLWFGVGFIGGFCWWAGCSQGQGWCRGCSKRVRVRVVLVWVVDRWLWTALGLRDEVAVSQTFTYHTSSDYFHLFEGVHHARVSAAAELVDVAV